MINLRKVDKNVGAPCKEFLYTLPKVVSHPAYQNLILKKRGGTDKYSM